MKPVAALLHQTLLATLVTAMAGFALAAEPKVLNVYNWGDYFGKTTLARFEQETGIKVKYDSYDSNEALQGKLMTGKSGYDLVFPSSHFFSKQVKAGVYRKLDKTKLSNYGKLDPQVMTLLTSLDPGNQYGVPYAMGTNGLTVNVEKVEKALGGKLPADPLDIVFKPELAAKVGKCGISFFDSGSEMFAIVLAYMGKSINTATEADFKAAEALLKPIRSSVRGFNGIPTERMAGGEFCVAMDFSGDSMLTQQRANEAKSGVKVQYFVPKQHGPRWIDMMGIPKDAPHPDNAHAFINFLLRPEIIAELTRDIYYAVPNTGVTAYLPAELKTHPVVFPPEAVSKTFDLTLAMEPNRQRLLTDAFNRFKASK